MKVRTRLEKFRASSAGAYGAEPLSQWCREEGGRDPEIVQRDREAEGFEVIPKRWIVERTISWIGRNHRMSKDHGRKVRTSETPIELMVIHLIPRRLARQV